MNKQDIKKKKYFSIYGDHIIKYIRFNLLEKPSITKAKSHRLA